MFLHRALRVSGHPRVTQSWGSRPGTGLGPQAGLTDPSWVPPTLPGVRNGKE